MPLRKHDVEALQVLGQVAKKLGEKFVEHYSNGNDEEKLLLSRLVAELYGVNTKILTSPVLRKAEFRVT